jgi:hypothetical protein
MDSDHMVGIQRIKYAGNVLSDAANPGGSIGQAALVGAKPANDLGPYPGLEELGLDHPPSVFICQPALIIITTIYPRHHSKEAR